jgi:hypothetical protein
MDLAAFSSSLIRLIQVHGPWIISVVVALESAGVPLPGETILVAAALLAAATNQIDIAVVERRPLQVRSSEMGSDTPSGAASECSFFANTGGTFVSMKTDC